MELQPTDDETGIRAWFATATAAIERCRPVDGAARVLRPLASQLANGPGGGVLRGEWLGHAAHPLLTDLPLGSWTSASLLDLLGGRAARSAATRLVGVGLLGVAPTVATGLAEYATVGDRPVERVATAHAVGNVAVTALYLGSWRARHRGRHGRGVMLALAGAAGAMATGYLGGHLAFARRVGIGERG